MHRKSYAQNILKYTHTVICNHCLGGCAHAFDRKAKVGDEIVNFTFDSGPTIVLGERIYIYYVHHIIHMLSNLYAQNYLICARL